MRPPVSDAVSEGDRGVRAVQAQTRSASFRVFALFPPSSFFFSFSCFPFSFLYSLASVSVLLELSSESQSARATHFSKALAQTQRGLLVAGPPEARKR